jgi:hypothetical protein
MIERIAYHLGRNDEEPNIRLAEELAKTKDAVGIEEIARGLEDKKEQVASDCIKVLYEVGYRNPSLIAAYAEVFMTRLKSRKNRLVWGSAIALAQIAELRSEYLFRELDTIYQAYKEGSVITVDNCISIFAGIARSKDEYRAKISPLLIEHLENCRPKEMGQHAERAFVCVSRQNAKEFRAALLKRRDSLPDAQRKRIDKLLKKMEKEEFPA